MLEMRLHVDEERGTAHQSTHCNTSSWHATRVSRGGCALDEAGRSVGGRVGRRASRAGATDSGDGRDGSRGGVGIGASLGERVVSR